MLEEYWLGATRWHHSHISDGLLEGLNSIIQAAKRRACGYRTNRNYIAMIYLVAGKLNAGPAADQQELRELVAVIIPGYNVRQMTSDLRRLRRKGFIRRVPQANNTS
jgi:Transposase